MLSANMPVAQRKCVGRDLQGLLGVECLILRDTHALSLSERLLEKEEEAVSNFAMLDLCGALVRTDGRRQFLNGKQWLRG